MKSLLKPISKYMSNFTIRGTVKPVDVDNEKYQSFAKGSKDREDTLNWVKKIREMETIEVPCIVNGEEIFTGKIVEVKMPDNIEKTLFKVHLATEEVLAKAVTGALEAKKEWESIEMDQRCSVFYKAADLISGEFRPMMNGYIMATLGKTMWQAEIDLVEMVDFFRFNNKYALEMYSTNQPGKNFPGVWNKLELRPLEGFVTAISPFNFAAIQSNLNCSPVLMGNVSIWKPGTSTALAAYMTYKMLKMAGLPTGVIQFCPCNHTEFTKVLVGDKNFSGVHFTGSTATFNQLWKDIAKNIDKYITYPKIVGETGGKNFHIFHESANVDNFVQNTIRGAFEYSGQKCSATSRCYVPKDMWEKEIKAKLISEAKKLKVGKVDEPTSFTSCVIDEKAFDRISGFIDRAKKCKECKILAGGEYSKKEGWYIQPTLIECTDPKNELFHTEIFGPVVAVYPYEMAWEEVLHLVDSTSDYALTGSIFCNERKALTLAQNILKNSCGNLYINDKSTGAVVNQQPFGGARKSGTNDKAGSAFNLYRWISPRSIKETYTNLKSWGYPSIDIVDK